MKEKGYSVTFMSLFIKSFSLSLFEFPNLNATYDFKNKPYELNVIDNHNISFALDSP